MDDNLSRSKARASPTCSLDPIFNLDAIQDKTQHLVTGSQALYATCFSIQASVNVFAASETSSLMLESHSRVASLILTAANTLQNSFAQITRTEALLADAMKAANRIAEITSQVQGDVLLVSESRSSVAGDSSRRRQVAPQAPATIDESLAAVLSGLPTLTAGDLGLPAPSIRLPIVTGLLTDAVTVETNHIGFVRQQAGEIDTSSKQVGRLLLEQSSLHLVTKDETADLSLSLSLSLYQELRIGVQNMPAHKIEIGHEDSLHDVAMDYYGKRLATALSDNTIKIIGITGSSSQQLAVLYGHKGPVWRVAWAHPKFGSVLASCSYDGQVIIWKESNQNEWLQAHVFNDHKTSVNSIAWAPHELGLCLACGSSDGNISIFTTRDDGGWDTARIEQAHPVGVTSVSWAPSTAPGAFIGSGLLDPVQKLASGGCDNTVRVWKLDNGIWKLDCIPTLQMHTDWVRDVAWAPNLGLPKSTIASGSQDGKVIIWTCGKGEQWKGKILKDFKTPVWTVSWSLTGNLLSVADANNNVTLWKEAVDGGEWEEVSTLES